MRVRFTPANGSPTHWGSVTVDITRSEMEHAIRCYKKWQETKKTGAAFEGHNRAIPSIYFMEDGEDYRPHTGLVLP